jgi:hypothetical protein
MILAGAVVQGGSDDGDGDIFITTGLLGYELAPGIIHFAHRNPGRAFASFGIRLGMPLVGVFLGAAAASGCDGFLCETSGAGSGLLLGMAGAMAIDAALLAYEKPRAPTQDARVAPLLRLGPREAWLGLGGEL